MSKMAKTAVVLMILTIVSKVLGFGREIMLGASYGVTDYAEAYLIALEIPSIIIASIATAISTTYIPMFYEINEDCGEKRALKFTSNLVGVVSIICTIFIILTLVFTDQVISIIAPGFSGEKLMLTVEFTRILVFSTLFIGIGYITTSYLQIKENFTIPGLIGLPYNIIIMVSIYISLNTSVYVLAWGTLIAYASQLIMQLPYAKKEKFKFSAKVDFKDEYLKKMLVIVAPIFIGVAVNQINVLVDKSLASTLPSGSVAALNYANKLNWFIITIFIASIASVIYPKISELATKNKNNEFIQTITTSVNTVVLLVVPISVGAIILAEPIVTVLFQRGEFDERAVVMTSGALIFYSIGMLGFGLRDILSRVFYSLKDTKTPMINGAIALVLNIILNIILIRYMGHQGLALSTSISSILTVILLFISLSKKVPGIEINKITQTLLKVILASLVMGIITSVSYNLLGVMFKDEFIQNVLRLIISVLAGVVTYAIAVVNMKIKEIDLIIEKVKEVLSKIKK